METKWTKWYAMTSHVIAYRSFELLFGTHTFHFNCFFAYFNCVFSQIRCLSSGWYKAGNIITYINASGSTSSSELELSSIGFDSDSDFEGYQSKKPSILYFSDEDSE